MFISSTEIDDKNIKESIITEKYNIFDSIPIETEKIQDLMLDTTLDINGVKIQIDKICDIQEKILSNQKKTLNEIEKNSVIIAKISERMTKMEEERQKDKKTIAQALIIFENIKNTLDNERKTNFHKTTLKGIEEIKNALLRIYDFVEKIG